MSASSSSRSLTIGELAVQSGLTVRALRHYDQLGLLRPERSESSGYRRYGPDDIERLYRIRALKSLGMPLAEIGTLLDSPQPGDGLLDLVSRQLEQIRSQQRRLGRLERDLGVLLDVLGGEGEADPGRLLSTIGEMEMLKTALRHDYSNQARRYDASRGVSPDVMSVLVRALGGGPGRELLDVGGGTGNYAAALRARGWSATILDASADMRATAERKGLTTVAGDATSLPFAGERFDAVTMISMLHQVSDWRTALEEARRVLRPGARLVIVGLASDHLRHVTWAYDLFPSMREFALDRRPSLAEMTAMLPGATVTPIWFTDLADASIAALCAHPTAMLDPERRRQTSFFERLERDHPDELEHGLRDLRRRLAAGDDPRTSRQEARTRLGDASAIAWHTPATFASPGRI